MDRNIRKRAVFFRALGFTALCILANILLKSMAENLELPFYIDMVGTVVSTYFFGPVWGIVTGVGTDVIYGLLTGWKSIPFAITALFLVYAVQICINKRFFERFKMALVSSFWLGIMCLVVSMPICMVVYDGMVGNMWGDALYEMLQWKGTPHILCSIAGNGVIEIVDKQVTVVLAYFIICLIKKIKKYTRQEKIKRARRKRVAGAAMLLALVLSLAVPGDTLLAEDSENYEGEIYNNQSGMMSSEANVIGETDDGIIWIGSYAGLTKYDGVSFEFVRESGISNVNNMFTDSQGRLWIGTNDSGIYRYEEGIFSVFTMEDGMTSDIIRSFAEDDDGNVYVGTSDSICVFDSEDNITELKWDGRASVTNVTRLIYTDGMLCGVAGDGTAFCIDTEDESYSLLTHTESDVQYQCVAKTTEGVLVGGSDGCIYKLKVDDNAISISKWFDTKTSDIIYMMEASNGYVWICGENSFGYLDASKKYHEKTNKDFDGSFENIHEDYQGNIWIASSRYGVIKLSSNQFVDVFGKAGIDDATVNAVVKYEGRLYCGTDSGVYVIDLSNYTCINNELTKTLKGVRTRSLYIDSQNRLWVGTYGDNGLICWNGKEIVESYTMESKGTTSNKFRCIYEMQDNTIAVGTADGLNFIKNGKVTATITEADGLESTQILCLTEGRDGSIYVGSDGAGIYEIKDNKIVNNYTKDDGLSSGVIMRMMPYDDGYFVVTSNSLCFMDDDGIRSLEEFPYFNNYDVMIKGSNAYVTSSAGLYVAGVDDILSGEPLRYQLYDVDMGLANALTANSWNYIDADGSVYLCSNSGVIHFDEKRYTGSNKYKYGITEVVCDGEIIEPYGHNYIVPTDAKNITISASVRNYTMCDTKVRFYVEGFGREKEAVKYTELEPINLNNMSAGTYKICFEILDRQGENVVQSKIFFLTKEAQIWETSRFRIYLVLVLGELFVFTIWTIVMTLSYIRNRSIQEEMYRENEEKLTIQVKEKTKELEQKKNEVSALLDQTILALSSAVDAKDRYTSGHSKRVAEYARAIARRMGKNEDEVLEIYYAGLLHDVGKIRVPDDIINKPGKLTDEEFNYIKLHPVAGHHILKEISGNRRFSEGARFHHERFDGKGYPNGLVGKNIPEIARIIGVADAYDAMASDRSYRNALPQNVVREEIEKGRGTQFDPEIADVMLKLIDEDKNYTMRQTAALKKNILVVDDEPMNIKIVEFALKNENLYHVFSANSGMAAIEKLEKEDIDLVLLDIEMPEMDGFDTLEKIRESKDVPVVFMTADKDIETIERAEAMGVEDYLTKPFLPMALKEVVHSILN